MQVHSDCEKCPLWETASIRGIPTRLCDSQTESKPGRAIVFVGEAPSHSDDLKGCNWTNWAGTLLHKFIDSLKLVEQGTIYLTNACRCKPPYDGNLTQGYINKCRGYLEDDLAELAMYHNDIVVVACGASAVKSIGKEAKIKTLKAAFSHQGEKVQVGATEVVMFSTYHPAILHPSRQPAKVHAVQSHFQLLKEYLTGEARIGMLNVKVEYKVEPPLHRLPMVTLDVETYGCIKGRNQTVFHPIKCQELDGVKLGDQIETVSLTWTDPVGYLRSVVMVWSDPDDRELLVRWLRKIKNEEVLLVGQNFKYDLLMLMFNDPVLARLFAFGSVRLDDLMLAGFLLSEQQPEKGLKEVAALIGIKNYVTVMDGGVAGRYLNAHDPDLHLYNATDTVVTYYIYEYVTKAIERRYGTKSPKTSKINKELRNRILWECTELEKNGIVFSKQKLRKIHTQMVKKCKNAEVGAKTVGVLLRGKDSQKSKVNWVEDALTRSGLEYDPRVELTKKQKRVSFGVNNVKLLLEEGVDDIPTIAGHLHDYAVCGKMVNSYTDKLLTIGRKGAVVSNYNTTTTYPTWYPFPLRQEGSSDEGGTIQSRFSASNPSAQNLPGPIEECMVSRYPYGKSLIYDASQLELRLAAWLSGDPLLMQAYVDGLDLHTETACGLFGLCPGEVTYEQRQLAKTVNFLVLYRGGPNKLQETARKKLGMSIDLDECRRVINQWYADHAVFGEWQDSLIDMASTNGYLILPTGWSRTFGIGDAAASNAVNEICNFPIQTIASQTVQWITYDILQTLRRLRTPHIMGRQVHDSIRFEIPYTLDSKAEQQIDQAIYKCASNSVFLDFLEQQYNRRVPIIFEKKEAA